MRGKFRLQEDYVYKMPVHFGGDPFYPVRVVYDDMTILIVKYQTDAEFLLQFIPEEFELLEPSVTVQFSNCREVDWMSAGEYRILQVTAPVRFLGNSEGLTGEYGLVVWENKTCPILEGREQDGVPKIFADIACERHVEDHWFTSASYESNTFFTIDFHRGAKLPESAVAQMNEHPGINLFCWRYLPNLGKGGPSLSQITLYPQEVHLREVWKGEGQVLWTPLTREQHPCQSHIIASLAGLPVKGYLSALMMNGRAQLNVADSRILSGED